MNETRAKVPLLRRNFCLLRHGTSTVRKKKLSRIKSFFLLASIFFKVRNLFCAVVHAVDGAIWYRQKAVRRLLLALQSKHMTLSQFSYTF